MTDQPTRSRSGAAPTRLRRGTAPTTKAVASLPASMVSGKASPTRAATGDKAAFAYLQSLPPPPRGIALRVDAIASMPLPGLRRAVTWGLAYCGTGNGWCFCYGGFADHVKVRFVNGASLEPVPPVAPQAMGKLTRGVEMRASSDLDERQLADWMRQIVARPGVGVRTPTT